MFYAFIIKEISQKVNGETKQKDKKLRKNINLCLTICVIPSIIQVRITEYSKQTNVR